MQYKKNLHEVNERMVPFWKREAQDEIRAQFLVRNPELEELLRRQAGDIPIDSADLVDEKRLFDLWDYRLQIKTELRDDSVPVAMLQQYDQGLYCGVVGAPITFCYDPGSGNFSSMNKPYLSSWDDLDTVVFQENHPLLKRLESDLRYFAEHAAGKFGIAPILAIDTLNFVMELRGATQAMYDLYDHREKLKDLFRMALDMNKRIYTLHRNSIGETDGGAFSRMGMEGTWHPWESIPVSVDAYHFTSPGTLIDLGLEEMQELIDFVGHGYIHLHANGWHLIPDILQLKNLTHLFLPDEKPRTIDHIWDLRKKTGDLPLIATCSAKEFAEKLDKRMLPGNVCYWIRPPYLSSKYDETLPTVEEANALMEKVYQYKPPEQEP